MLTNVSAISFPITNGFHFPDFQKVLNLGGFPLRVKLSAEAITCGLEKRKMSKGRNTAVIVVSVSLLMTLSSPVTALERLPLNASCRAIDSQLGTVNTNLWLAKGYLRLWAAAELAGADSSEYDRKLQKETKGIASAFRKASKKAKDPSTKQLLNSGIDYASNGSIDDIERIVEKVEDNLDFGKC